MPNVKSDQARPGETLEGGAIKLDFGKAPVYKLFMKYFPHAIIAVSYVSEYGLRKYNPDGDGDGTGWRDVKDGVNRYGDAEARHMLKEITEGGYDILDSGLPHAAQDAWNSMARLERLIVDGKIKIMVGNDIQDGKPVLGTAKEVG